MEKIRNKKWNWGMWLILVLIGVAVLFIVVTPLLGKQVAASRVTGVLSNGKDIYVSIRDYSNSYGKSPATQISANDAFRKLFQKTICNDEAPFSFKQIGIMFFSSSPPECHLKEALYPDELKTDGELLKPGENIYSYWTTKGGEGFEIESLSADSHALPILSAPMLSKKIDKASEGIYETESMAGQAVVMYADGSGEVYQIDLNTGGLLDESGSMMKAGATELSVWYPEGVKPAP